MLYCHTLYLQALGLGLVNHFDLLRRFYDLHLCKKISKNIKKNILEERELANQQHLRALIINDQLKTAPLTLFKKTYP
jgi:hypothetical protein